jgi:hypothetical protein
MMKLTEFFNTKNNFQLEESEGGSFRLRVPFLQADVETANHRVYPFQILAGAVNKLQKRLYNAPAFGSSKHLERQEVDDISHLIEAVSFEKGTAFAILRIVPTERGRDIAAIIKNGGQIGVSARGAGTVSDGKVQSDFSLEGIDFTLSPASGHYANQKMICESAPLDVEAKLDEETERQKMKDKYYDAIRTAGFRGDFETFKLTQDKEGMDRVSKFRERYALAIKAGFRGTETQYLDAMEK